MLNCTLNRCALVVVFSLFMLAFPVRAETVRVAIGFALAPYVFADEDKGIEVDIVRAAFKAVGQEAVFTYLPNLRLPVSYRKGEVDCVAANADYDLAKDSGKDTFDSDTTVVYRNYAISLASSKLKIASIRDLHDKVVLGFNNAVKYLGPEYAVMVKENSRYTELADQSLQVCMLYSRRVEVVVSEKRIFLYWRKQMLNNKDAKCLNLKAPLEFHSVFPPAPRHVAFKNPDLKDQFNSGLETIRKNGEYDAIVARYVGVEDN